MTRAIRLSAWCGALVLTLALHGAQQAPEGFRLVWQDEFDHDGPPDPTRWNYDVGGHGWGNKEPQFYTQRRPENARVEGGHLVIEARHEPWQGAPYTSARLVTRGKGDWTYGRVEVRAQLPRGRGSWPAIWMLPTTTAPMRWPDDGEIDIMEHVGFDHGAVHASVHTKAYHHSIGTQKTAKVAIPDLAEAFHVYALDWDHDRIRMSVDGREYFAFARESGDTRVWPFDGPFHLLLNVAVGGAWGGQQGIDESSLPYRLRVDYVRVYQRLAK
ncbi:glycoside hydrolase family 16 protein [Luteitalea pratensis]|uniref:glycoside hydrolase family 16 protein n=1 Tax=Luteitalea pratensis TaxID=1855912 RepID=UPI001F333CFD|nr:glycoside hydrolase family 16 protein [Luteitalea pratensis]